MNKSIKTVGIFSVDDFQIFDLTLNMAEMLSQNDYRVELIAPITRDALSHNCKRGFQIRRISLIRENSKRFRGLEFIIKTIFILWKKYDIVFGTDAWGFLVAHLLKRLKMAKVLIYYSIELELIQDARTRIFSRYLKHHIKDADMVISTGQGRAEVMKNKFKLSSLPLVIENCLLYYESRKDKGLRKILEERGDKADFVVIYQGGLNSDRCILEMIRSVEFWNINAVLVITGYGDKEYIREIEQEIKKDKFKHKVFYLGWIPGSRENLLRLTCGADLGFAFHRWRDLNLAYATYWTPTKIYDYLACGLPMVVSDNPSLEFIQGEGLGLCVNPERPNDIANAINKILGNHLLYKGMAKISKTLFYEKYNYQKQVKPFMGELKKIIK